MKREEKNPLNCCMMSLCNFESSFVKLFPLHACNKGRFFLCFKIIKAHHDAPPNVALDGKSAPVCGKLCPQKTASQRTSCSSLLPFGAQILSLFRIGGSF